MLVDRAPTGDAHESHAAGSGRFPPYGAPLLYMPTPSGLGVASPERRPRKPHGQIQLASALRRERARHGQGSAPEQWTSRMCSSRPVGACLHPLANAGMRARPRRGRGYRPIRERGVCPPRCSHPREGRRVCSARNGGLVWRRSGGASHHGADAARRGRSARLWGSTGV